MRLHVLSKRTFRPHDFTYPLRVWRDQLHDLALDVRLFHRHDEPGLVECDVLLVVSDVFGHDEPPRWLRWLDGYDPSAVPHWVDWLAAVRGKVGALVWCDNNAATGKFPYGDQSVFPHVDVYGKKQLLRDRALYEGTYYKRDWYCGQLYERYYAEILKMAPDLAEPLPGLTDAEIAKLAITWNHGLADYNDMLILPRQTYRPYWPFAHFRGAFADANTCRVIGLSCRIGTKYNNPVVAYARRETLRHIEEVMAGRQDVVGFDGRLSYRRYIDEMTKTRLVLSPFGFGEICWRDFETFLSGATLVKPRMDHIETWPDCYYEPGETYILYEWDFSNFAEVVADALDAPGMTREIGANGQARYLETLTPTFGEQFATRLEALAGRAVDARAQG